MTRPSSLRLATYNICWFAGLFDEHNRLIDDDRWSAIYDVTRRRQGQAIAKVMGRVDADLYTIIEAPNTGRHHNTVAALEHFADMHGLRARRALIGFESETDQEIAVLFDPDRFSIRHDPIGAVLPEGALDWASGPAPRFDSVFPLDLDGDGDVDLHRFSKPPLEAEVTVTGRDLRFRLIGVHAKSKAPYGAGSPADAVRISLLNRRKQLAQCAWLRARIDQHLDQGDPLVILGDFNDGPGQDKYERVYGRSGVEVVMGDPGVPERLLRNPYTRRRLTPFGERPSSARFFNRDKKGYLNALIDFIMLSADLADRTRPQWRIWHPFDDRACFEDDGFRQDLLDASDHFPVTVDLSLA